jgi:hypothetical protein
MYDVVYVFMSARSIQNAKMQSMHMETVCYIFLVLFLLTCPSCAPIFILHNFHHAPKSHESRKFMYIAGSSSSAQEGFV